MKTSIIITFGLSGLLMVTKGIIFTVYFFTIGVPTISILALLLWYRHTIKWYGRRLLNIYVFSENENDKHVYKRAKKHRKWLEKSGNEKDVQVVIILFRDKDNPTESWDEYQVRKVERIKILEIERHNDIQNGENREYYLKEVHGQVGITYDVPKPKKEKSNGLHISNKWFTSISSNLRQFISRSLQQD